MSYEINIAKTRSISTEQLLQNLSINNVKIGYKQTDSLSSEFLGYLNLYIELKSTRGVTINSTSSSFDIIINAVASHEDYNLAKDISVTLAKLSNSLIKTESSEKELEINEFESSFSEDWINSIKSGSASSFKSIVQHKKEWVKLPCCVRAFYFGDEVIKSISTKDENEFYNILCDKIREVQYLDSAKIRIPEIGQLENDENTLIIFNEELNQFIPKVDFIYINSESVYKIPHNLFIQTKSIDLERLDEKQFLAKNINSSSFKNLKLEFSSHIQSDTKSKKDTQNKKKWWKVW